MSNKSLVFLPNEIINKILMYREIHPLIQILKPLIAEYNEYIESSDYDNDIHTYCNWLNVLFYKKNFIDDPQGDIDCIHCLKFVKEYYDDPDNNDDSDSDDE